MSNKLHKSDHATIEEFNDLFISSTGTNQHTILKSIEYKKQLKECAKIMHRHSNIHFLVLYTPKTEKIFTWKIFENCIYFHPIRIEIIDDLTNAKRLNQAISRFLTDAGIKIHIKDERMQSKNILWISERFRGIL